MGDFSRFESPDKLVAYLGLHPKIRQSGNSPAIHLHITKAGRSSTRGMLVEAAWTAAKAPGPFRAFYHRIKQRRGFQIADWSRPHGRCSCSPGTWSPRTRTMRSPVRAWSRSSAASSSSQLAHHERPLDAAPATTTTTSSCADSNAI
ncbi:transposase [Microbacterium aurum]